MAVYTEMIFSVSLTSNVQGKLNTLLAEANTRAVNATTQAKAYADTEFKRRVNEQIALPQDKVNALINVTQTGARAKLVAKDDAVPLSEYPHRASLGAVDVQINPGAVTRIPNAVITRDGKIGFFTPGGGFKELIGPGIDQIANTEFDDIGKNVSARMRRALK